MFEELPFIIGFMILSVIFSYILIKYSSGAFLKIVQALAVVGIIIHELCHLFMCLITHAPIESFSLVKKFESEKTKKVRYYGEVKVHEQKTTFIQAFLISFAPLYLSFWLFFFLLNHLINTQVSELIFFICIFTMISLVLSAAPSFADLALIPKAFQNNSRHSSYQILLLGFSILTTWLIFITYDIQLIHEIFIYLGIGGFYFVFKYGFKMIGYILYSINSRRHKLSRPHKIRIKEFTRHRYKPKKPRGDQW